METNYFNGIQMLSNTLGMISPKLIGHQKRVAYIAVKIAEKMNLGHERILNTLIASLLHDIGALNYTEVSKMIEFDVPRTLNHPYIGYALLNSVSLTKSIAPIVLHHHVYYSQNEDEFSNNQGIPLESYIISIADRVDILRNQSNHILHDAPRIIEKISRNAYKLFHPECVEAFLAVSQTEEFWLNMVELPQSLTNNNPLQNRILSLSDIKDIALICANIIDFRSPFTATHSVGVSSVSRSIAECFNISQENCLKIEIAGLLHDIGKLNVPLEILEKPGSLIEQEFAIMRAHTYYTSVILENFSGHLDINHWASYHHEYLDGSGYPFHKESSSLDLESQIVMVADIYTALSENRPYRGKMSLSNVIEVMTEMANKEKINAVVVATLIKNIRYVEDRFKEKQMEYHKAYREIADLLDVN